MGPVVRGGRPTEHTNKMKRLPKGLQETVCGRRPERKKAMKKTMVAGMALMLAMVMALPVVQAQDKPNQPDSGWYCPRMGRGGMMGQGRGLGPRGQGCRRWAIANGPLSKDQARQLLENYVRTSGIPGLKLGGFEERGEVYEGEVVTELGAPVGKIQVDKNTGFFRNAS